jgi:hypothetical protein
MDQNLRRRPTGLRERVEKIRPTRLRRPAYTAIVEPLLRPVFGQREGISTIFTALDRPEPITSFNEETKARF